MARPKVQRPDQTEENADWMKPGRVQPGEKLIDPDDVWTEDGEDVEAVKAREAGAAANTEAGTID